MARRPVGGRRIPRRIRPSKPSNADTSNSGRVSERIRTIATVLSPLAVGTILLYYLTLFISLILYQLHRRLLALTNETLRTRLATLLSQSWLLWLPMCVALMVFVSPLMSIAIPGTMTMALLGAIYGDVLRRNFTRQRRWVPTTRVMVAILLALILFWDTERLARAVGEGFAANITANPQQLVTVTIYSAKSLELPPGQVVETTIGGPDSAYHYRYTGLRLLQRSGNKYLMLNDGWEPVTGRVFVIADSNDLRMEFTR